MRYILVSAENLIELSIDPNI